MHFENLLETFHTIFLYIYDTFVYVYCVLILYVYVYVYNYAWVIVMVRRLRHYAVIGLCTQRKYESMR